MAHDDGTRRKARKAFIYGRKAIPMIALEVSASEATVRRWKAEAREKGDDWDTARSANMIAGEGLEAVTAVVIEEFVILYQATIEGVKSAPDMPTAEKVKALSSLADAFHKTIAAAGRVSPKLSELGIAMDVLKRLAGFTREHHPDQVEALLVVLEPFGAHLSEVYG